jgi:hypothetical protein
MMRATIATASARQTAPGRSSSPLLQRKCACGGSAGFSGKCEECGKTRRGVQRRAAGPATGLAPPIVHDVLRSPGQPLDPATRAYTEQRFGHDFSKVRVHADSRAARSADAVDAFAYTVGRDVVFASGHYAPHTAEGRKLLVHELTHVAQQQQAGGQERAPLKVAADGGNFEQQALFAETAIGPPVARTSSAVVQRRAKELSTPRERCGENWTCATPANCKKPDKGVAKSTPSAWWTLKVMIDIEAPSAKAVNLIKANVGHTYLEFSESNGNVYTYGFYPSPSSNLTLKRPEVAGCVVHPDTAHKKCTDYQETFSLTEVEYTDALSLAQFACGTTPKYNVYNFNCTTFASSIVFAAEQELPPMHGKVGHGVLSGEADNPNTLYENLIKRDAASKPAGAGK